MAMRRCDDCVHARYVPAPTPCLPGIWECSARGGMAVLHLVARALACRAYAGRYRLHVEDGSECQSGMNAQSAQQA